jgi:ERCC4-related helicase
VLSSPDTSPARIPAQITLVRKKCEFHFIEHFDAGYRLLFTENCFDCISGLTQNQQEDVVRHFRDGLYKVVVCTSVVEEGLDISKCNLVIRYEFVTHENAMIQARGE